MRNWFTACLPLLVVWSPRAFAECEVAYRAADLGNDISAMSGALRSAQPAVFQEAGQSLLAGIPCIQDPMAPMILASVYRYAGLQTYFVGKEEEARAWFRSSLELDSTFDWDVAELPFDDPIRPVFETERERSSAEKKPVADGAILKVPDGMRLTADGRPLTKAALTLDRPHLIQAISKADNSVKQVWLVQGNEFPAELLARVLPDSPVAAAATGVGSTMAVRKIERTRPPLKTPALITGGVFMAAGMGLYAASFSSRKKFDTATTLDEAKSHQATTNALVLTAGGAFAAGAGLTYVGFMLDGGPGLQWRGRF